MIFSLLLMVTFPLFSEEIQVQRNSISAEILSKNGSTFIFTSIMDQSVITVHPNGDVTTELFSNSPEQRWTLVPHPLDYEELLCCTIEPGALEFKQEVVPYNMLSGYEDPPENPGVFPRPLGLANRENLENDSAWNILIRGRWCIQANGYGYQMDMDDCEYFTAPWQLWQLHEVS